jgi:acrylyl-CoA reductase (NADPH)/3-hydroxypropionyl-CoA dehydratase/3-hydroxypropionyl-CoA synthetase
MINNPISTKKDYEHFRDLCRADLEGFHAQIAKREIHWYHPESDVWITYSDQDRAWIGFEASTGNRHQTDKTDDFTPWQKGLVETDAPYYRWFQGACTNACFNEVDRHVLEGYGHEIAFFYEGDRWDVTKNQGRGGPVTAKKISRKKLLFEAAKCALVLENLGLNKGDRVCLNMPNIPEHIYFIEACKRKGIIYTSVLAGHSSKLLSDLLQNTGAKVLITADGMYRNAQLVGLKDNFTDVALDQYISFDMALELIQEKMCGRDVDEETCENIVAYVRNRLGNEITLDRAEIMSCIGQALGQVDTLNIKQKAHLRTELAKVLLKSPKRVETVLIIQHTGQAITVHPDRDKWASDLMRQAEDQLYLNASDIGIEIKSEFELFERDEETFIRVIYQSSRCTPVESEFPLFISYTSGSTGKPKGLVHVHGGYTVGVAFSLRIGFDAIPGQDTIYVLAELGWIAGQTYLVSAAFLTRVTAVMSEGSPLFPSAGRFANILERYKVTIFKATVTCMKAIMSNPQNIEEIKAYDLKRLKLATLFAEPCSPDILEFGARYFTKRFTNSYWSTEHGALTWTFFLNNSELPSKPNAHNYPFPWIFGDVWVKLNHHTEPGAFREAFCDEKGEVVITRPFPYMARTLWGDQDNFLEKFEQGLWRGDFDRYKNQYWTFWAKDQKPLIAFTQGDFAVKHRDGSYTFHGRSDEVINVSGQRIGTEEIESVLLKDKIQHPKSPIENVIVVGAPHKEKGLAPIAFIQTRTELTSEDTLRLNALVLKEKGENSIPLHYIAVKDIPITRNGKYVRRVLKNIINVEALGDISAIANPGSLDEIRKRVDQWRQKQVLEDSQTMFENFTYFRIQYFPVVKKQHLAIITITNPPVNALNERGLDELNSLTDRLMRREDVKAIIFTGDGTNAFIAGADIKELLGDIHTVEDALTLANNAHLAFTKLECMNKPVIAAINGVALGGGNEFALACHYRICSRNARFAQPEIFLNLIPGYGATQRLPRIIERKWKRGEAIKKSLEMMLSGRQYTSKEALEMGLVDEIAENDALSAAVQLAKRFIHDNKQTPELNEAFEYRQKVLSQWMSISSFPDDVVSDPDIHRIINQLKQWGKAETIKKIIEGVKVGYEKGYTKGLGSEAELFAKAVVSEKEGKTGLREFLSRKSFPVVSSDQFMLSQKQEKELIKKRKLLEIGAPFFPGITKRPTHQYAYAILRNPKTGFPLHGDPIQAEKKIVVPIKKPGPNEVLLYMLTSEINFNDIWAVTGIPVSHFARSDKEYYVTGNGGLGFVIETGSEVMLEGRLKVGDLVVLYSGQSDLLSQKAGQDPMFCNFKVQGYETPDGSHQQFVLAQAPQCFKKPVDLSLEKAGSYVQNMGTIYRALFSTLQIKEGKSIFIEGAATGSGLEALKIAVNHKMKAYGLVSNEQRAGFIKQCGAKGYINRKSEALKEAFCKVPEDPSQWKAWDKAGEAIIEAFKAQNKGKLADYVVSHAGEKSFPRTFQLLANGGTLTFFGASSGYHFTFLGKQGASDPHKMLESVQLKPNLSALTYYGLNTDDTGLVDTAGLEIIETLIERGFRLVVACYTKLQQEFLQSLGFGDSLKQVISIEELITRFKGEFIWPERLDAYPNPFEQLDTFKQAVQKFNEKIFKPFATYVGRSFKTSDNPRGYPDIVFERAGHDKLSVSCAVVKPFTGKVLFSENMAGRRYSFYAPQVWMRQRKIFMPTAKIFGTHMSNASEVMQLNEMIEAHSIEVSDPLAIDFNNLPNAHQEMWENKHQASVYVCNHAIPKMGLKTKEELFLAWGHNHSQKLNSKN